MAKRKNRSTYAAAIALAILFSVAALWQPFPLSSLDLFLFDTSMNLREKGKPVPLVLIEIDEKSTRQFGSWPWPRKLLAEMVTILAGEGAKIIALDISLSEQESNPGLRELRNFKEKFHAYSFSRKDDGLRPWVLEKLEEAEASLDSDRILAESLKQAGNVVLPAGVTDGEDGKGAEEGDRALLRSVVLRGEPLHEHWERAAAYRISTPFSAFSQASLALGHTASSLNDEMEGRSHALFIPYKGGLLPSFALQTVISFLGMNSRQISIEDSTVAIHDVSIPLWKGEMLLDHRRLDDLIPRYSFSDVIQAKKVPASAKGKIVLIGLNLRETPKVPIPNGSAVSPVEFHAGVIHALVAKKFIARPSYMKGVEVAAIWAVAILSVFLFLRTGRWIGLTGTLALFVVVPVIGFFLFSLDLWARTASVAIFILVLCPTLFLSMYFSDGRGSRRSTEVTRQLGIRLQGYGMLDQALEQYQELPLDQDAKNLLYSLGLEYESRGMNDKALIAYTTIQKGGKFQDLDERILRLETPGDAAPPAARTAQEEDVEAEPEAIKKIGRYEVVQELGRGSMGLVYKAMDPKLNRLLAIKTVRFSDEFDADVVQEVRARFFREAEIAGRLAHPSIVTVYDVGEDQDLTYMAMEYLDGEDLEKYVRKDTLLPLRRVLDVVAHISDALDFAHKAGVIHRDIKPANIMLLRDGGVKVTDFGIAKAVSSSRTRTGVILGTPNYMSPEQIMGQRIDYRTDIFSLGVLFFQAMTGELPFHGNNLSTLLYEITQVKHPSVREIAEKIPRACEQIVDKALAKHPDQRFSSASEIGRLARLIIARMDEVKKQRSSTKPGA